MTNRRFYRTIVQVEVLSEQPLGNKEPIDHYLLTYQITDYDLSGSISIPTIEEVDGKSIAELAQAQGSAPEFFQVDSEDNDITT
jgi:hypothetical protein